MDTKNALSEITDEEISDLMDSGLNHRQARFALEYCVDMNATQAAIRSNYSPLTAYAIGAELLKKPQIRDAIQMHLRARSKRTAITADRVLEAFADIAFGSVDAKDADRLKALESLAKHLGIANDKLELTTPGDHSVKVVFVDAETRENEREYLRSIFGENASDEACDRMIEKSGGPLSDKTKDFLSRVTK